MFGRAIVVERCRLSNLKNFRIPKVADSESSKAADKDKTPAPSRPPASSDKDAERPPKKEQVGGDERGGEVYEREERRDVHASHASSTPAASTSAAPDRHFERGDGYYERRGVDAAAYAAESRATREALAAARGSSSFAPYARGYPPTLPPPAAFHGAPPHRAHSGLPPPPPPSVRGVSNVGAFGGTHMGAGSGHPIHGESSSFTAKAAAAALFAKSRGRPPSKGVVGYDERYSPAEPPPQPPPLPPLVSRSRESNPPLTHTRTIPLEARQAIVKT